MEPQQNINISLDKTTPIKCVKCENEVFIEGMMLRKVSKFISATEKDAIIPIGIMLCSICHEVLEETLPVQLKNKSE